MRTLALAAALYHLSGAPGAGETDPAKSSSTPPADGPAADKNPFTFWTPTPTEHLREMNALYDSPWTVDRGHFQLETYAVSYAHNHTTKWGADTTTDVWSAGASTLKAGVRNDLDLELAFTPYTCLRTKDNTGGGVTRQQGISDVTLRTKLNLWGNDGGPTALAVLPFVKLPTHHRDPGNDNIEGGFLVPLAVELPGGWWTIFINEFHCLHDFDGDGYHPAFANTVYFWHPIHGDLSGFVDFYSWTSTERGVPWWGSVDFGLTYLHSKHVQFDLGVSIGVSDAADDVNPYVGVSFRF
jgi:hypothetical protein